MEFLSHWRIQFLLVLLLSLLQMSESHADESRDSGLSADVAEYQRQANQCGAVALFAALEFFDEPREDIDGIAAECGQTNRGISLQAMAEYLQRRGFHAQSVRMTPEQLRTLDQPFIATMSKNPSATPVVYHYEFVPAVKGDEVWVIDAGFSGRKSIENFVKHWHGTGIVFWKRPPGILARLTTIDKALIGVVGLEFLALAWMFARGRGPKTA